MKRLAMVILVLGFGFCLNACSNEKKKTDWIEDQQDQTDVYAIPLDDSEVEEEQEEKEFERIEKEEALKKERESRN